MAKQSWWQRQNFNKNKNRKNKRNQPKGKNMTEKPVTPIAVGKELTEAEFQQVMEAHNTGGAFKQAVGQSCWDAGIEILSNCGKMKVPSYHIQFDLLAHQKINALKKAYPSLEWLAYLVGSVNHETNLVKVEDLIIPDSQKVTGASVYNVEYTWPVLPEGKIIIGVIHSHHTMGAFFSGTDDAYINQNHDVSIVVATAKGREIKSQIRVKTPCDAYVLAEDITYSVNYPQVLDEVAFETEFKSKISSYTPVQYINYRGNYLGNSSRGYSHRGIGSGGTNRFSGNPPRNSESQMGFGYDTEDLEDEFDNPYLMSSEELKDNLLDYYNPTEVDEWMNQGFQIAAQELNIVQQLCQVGVDVRTDNDKDWDTDVRTDNDKDWDTDIILELDELDAELDELDNDTNPQNGLGQVSRGVPLGDQDNGKVVWSTGDNSEDTSDIKQVMN